MQAVFETELDIPAADLWALLGDFGNMMWVPNVASCEVQGDGVGMVRILKTDDGLEVREYLDALDNAAMHLAYSIPKDAPMPILEYRATIDISDLGQGRSAISWKGYGEEQGMSAEEADAMMAGMYKGFVELAAAKISGQL